MGSMVRQTRTHALGLSFSQKGDSMKASVKFERREVVKVAVELEGIRPDASTADLERLAIDAYQSENAERVFEAEIGMVVKRAPIVRRLPGNAAKVFFILYKDLSTD